MLKLALTILYFAMLLFVGCSIVFSHPHKTMNDRIDQVITTVDK